jgi:hypothetical protein
MILSDGRTMEWRIMSVGRMGVMYDFGWNVAIGNFDVRQDAKRYDALYKFNLQGHS